MYRIGDLAREADVTVRTIRYYEELGLIDAPAREDREQRRYTDKDLIYLKRIIQLKSYGLTLIEIKEIIELGKSDPSGEKRRMRLLKHYREKISDAISRREKLDAYVDDLQWHIEQLENVDDFQGCPGPACADCRFLEKCRFAVTMETEEEI
ncbi:MAG: MerR family transcriptional regulator [Spirochaetales bacterium]|uniref:MerR family transcriptional regulator n=1 Tax=Candidatus Thalassospirochaeta sargassi TaxID=3119039 RepID=A0AAJ1II21_9SPIO|nr:MerR family transcriptional regulator [Spirochaetales bacterium]